ncbi:hypothetical protein [Flavobacterium terrae]|uniref:YD repeat-containing protein n=1 Tax=Flavobacterium terrae TaxID=415425 RepID=A0A1M6DK25_9FLAO|nr:hypothetical protein [Flavobacterium terrae]SHI73520.1 hypothetical protein SAMN05444363_1494 [Flavobacterium terrae]
MRKIIVLMSFITLLLTSCSSDDALIVEAPITPSNNIKPIQFKHYDYNSPISYVIGDFNYSGDKLDKVIYNNDKEDRYTYNNDLITRIDYYQSGILKKYRTFFYNTENKLSEYKVYNVSGGTSNLSLSESFTHNIDGTITSISINNIETEYYKYYLNSNGNVFKLETYGDSSYSTIQYTELMTYDNKYTPFKNILGFNKIVMMFVESGGIENNLLSHDLSHTIYELDYNNENYPVKITEKNTTSNTYSDVFEYYY